jgi:hypothetical protein
MDPYWLWLCCVDYHSKEELKMTPPRKENLKTGVWTADKKLNDYLVLKGTKTNHCLHTDGTTENIQLNCDTNDFELGATPNYNLQLKNRVYGVKNNNGLYLDPSTNPIEIKLDTEYLVVNSNQLSTTFY